MTEVKLIYFKESGNYYSEGSYNSESGSFWVIVGEINKMLKQGKRPGLVDGFGFHVLAEIYVEVGPMPHLFIRRNN